MNEEIRALRSELALVKLQFSQRLGAVESRLNNLLAQEEVHADQQQQVVNQTEDRALSVTPNKRFEDTSVEGTSAKVKTISTEEYFASINEVEATPSRLSLFITVFVQGILSSFFDWLSPVTEAYQSYKDRGMLGIFILTLVGIGLTLAGFGYLMQLLIDQLAAGAKSLLMCIAAILVMGLGIVLKIKTRFGEFATAIVTLGILLSYSTVYFSGSVYGILPNIIVLILYLVIAIICHVLALWLDTKVIAALGIVGIATMPILSNVITIEPLYYLLSLAFVVCSSLILSYKHVGPWLANLSLAFTLVSLEWLIGFENIQISVWLVNLFYLLFFTYVLATLLKEKIVNSQTLIFLAALVGSTIYFFFQAVELFTTAISLSFTFNTMLAISASILFYRVKRELTHFFILLAASWAVLTIVSAFSDAYWGIAWAIEGLLLLFIGRSYKFSVSIKQGQILTTIALLYCWAALAMYFPLPALKSVDGWVLSLMIVAIIATWQRLINNSEIFDKLTVMSIKPFLQLVEAAWLTILLIACAYIWLGNWTGCVVIVLQLALLFRARNCQQGTIEMFAASLIIVPLFYVYQGGLDAGSYRFMMLPLFAKLSLISAFAQLWLWSAFYRKYQADSAMKNIAEAVRIVFYMLIPICWVGSVIRRFDEDSLMLLWLSPLLALFLARKINHPLLIKETKVLTGLTSVALVLAIVELSLINSIITLFGFMFFYAIAYQLNRKEPVQPYAFICSWAVLTAGLALPIFIGSQTTSLFYGVISAALYWGTLFNTMNLSDHLRRNETFITVANLLLVIASWGLIFEKVSYVLVPVIFLIATLHQKEHTFNLTKLGKKLALNEDLFLHSIGAISYVAVLYALDLYRLDLLIAPVLAVHGATILFLKDKRLTTVKYSFFLILSGIVKLALIDAANALLWQKVVLFMGIGVFILLASFWYQKLTRNVDVLAESVEP